MTLLFIFSCFGHHSKQCYSDCEALVRERTSSLHAHSEQVRLARYLFKDSFYSEMKQDSKSALRQYRACYDIVKQLQVREKRRRNKERKKKGGVYRHGCIWQLRRGR